MSQQLLDVAKAVLAQFEAIQRHQHKLLVEGQSLESASVNWDEATLGQFIDFHPLIDAVASAGWQPIATAPKDGRRVLLGAFHRSGRYLVDVGIWESRRNDDAGAGWSYWRWSEQEPTHWQPLPAPPDGEMK